MTAAEEEETRKRILVIEDEPDIVRGLRDALEFEGFDVEAKGTGAEGLAAAMDWAPDCVLLDLMLPDDNGYRVCETLRQRDETVPIIILTAKAQETDKIRGLDAGADDYVTKPFSMPELLARIRVALRHHDQRPEGPDQSVLKVDAIKFFRMRIQCSVKRTGKVFSCLIIVWIRIFNSFSFGSTTYRGNTGMVFYTVNVFALAKRT